jgi:hypothetical protein
MLLTCAPTSVIGARVNPGEWLTRGTIWLALSLYCAAEVAMAKHQGCARIAKSRWLNTMGAATFLGHVACAFHFYHHWSHSAAHAETARQSAELTGWNSGDGLYVNYFFALVWTGDVIWSWARPMKYSRRSHWVSRLVRGFFFFMIFNGAVVFAPEPMRWYGLLLSIILVVCWLRAWRCAAERLPQPKPA